MSIHNSPLATSLYDVILKEETNHIIGRITKAYLEGNQYSFYNTWLSQLWWLSIELPAFSLSLH